jgi:TPR repeat protein
VRALVVVGVLVSCASPAPPRVTSPPLVTKPVPRPASEPTIEQLRASPMPEDRARAIVRLEASCAKGVAEHCHVLAMSLFAGTFVDRDQDRAKRLFGAACDAKYANACHQLAGLLQSEDRAAAARYYEKACQLDDASGCSFLAEMKLGAERDELRQRAFDMARERCERGESQGCFGAEYYLQTKRAQGAIPPEVWRTVRDKLQRACSSEVATACGELGVIHEKGYGGVPTDTLRGLQLYERACELREGRYCALASYGYTDAPNKNALKARGLQRAACELGYESSCFWASKAEEVEPAQRLALLEKGCALYDNSSCSELFTHYTQVATEATRAGTIARQLCGLGFDEHCNTLGAEREKAGDRDAARALYRIACRNGDYWHGCGRELALSDETSRAARLAELPASRRDLALYACCDDAKQPATNATAAVLRLAYAIRAGDATAVTAQIHAKKMLTVRIGSHGDAMGDTEVTHTIKKKAVDMKKLAGVMSFDESNLECGPFADDEAQCTTAEGGFGANYTVAKLDGRLWVVRVNEESH